MSNSSFSNVQRIHQSLNDQISLYLNTCRLHFPKSQPFYTNMFLMKFQLQSKFAKALPYLVIPFKLWCDDQPHSEYSSSDWLNCSLQIQIWKLVNTLLYGTAHLNMVNYVSCNIWNDSGKMLLHYNLFTTLLIPKLNPSYLNNSKGKCKDYTDHFWSFFYTISSGIKF